MTKFVHDGNALDYTPPADLAAGDVVVQGELVAVAKRAIKAGELGALHPFGVFDFPKATGVGTGTAAGTRYFWDAGASIATPADGGGANKFIGKSVKESLDADATARLRLSQ